MTTEILASVQVCLGVNLSTLALELATQASPTGREGIKYSDLMTFIEELDTRIGDSEFTEELYEKVQELRGMELGN